MGCQSSIHGGLLVIELIGLSNGRLVRGTKGNQGQPRGTNNGTSNEQRPRREDSGRFENLRRGPSMGCQPAQWGALADRKMSRNNDHRNVNENCLVDVKKAN